MRIRIRGTRRFTVVLTLLPMVVACWAVCVPAAEKSHKDFYFYYPDSPQINLGRLKTETDLFFPRSRMRISFQPFVNLTDFNRKLNNRRAGFVLAPEWYARPGCSSDFVDRIRRASADLGLEITASAVDQSRFFKRSFNHMAPDVDVFRVLADPVVYTLENIAWLKETCIRRQLISIGQSQNLARYGLLLSIHPDPCQIGLQAASIAGNILVCHQKPGDLGVVHPLGTRIVLNMKTARRIGVDISPASVNMATEEIK